MLKEENGIFKILWVRNCREVEKPAHGKCLSGEMNARHLAQNLLEMIRSFAIFKTQECRMFES